MVIVAVCFDGVDDDALVEAARELLRSADRVEAWCAHGDEAQRLLQNVDERHHGPRHPPAHHRSLDAEQAEAIARRGAELLRRAGFTAAAKVLCGRDAGEAVAAASSVDIMLVVGAGHRSGTGPRSIGHVARFVIDHANGPVLVLRSY
jgi:nucleotide-binding universal stress UspA family protein